MDTGSRKWGRPYLTRAFFDRVGASMPERILLVMAKRNGRYIAGAINFIGDDALYGRNWGAIEERPFLHFEVCYYQAIDFALAHGLKRVEAGAQGEHKLARGYRPVVTYSAHEFADAGLTRAIADYLRHEREAVARTIAHYEGHAPFNDAAKTPRRPKPWETALKPTYDPNNIFAKILRGEAPCVKVYEDEVSLAFMDVMPRAEGHTLVIPKVPARNLFDIEPEDLARFMPSVQKVTHAVRDGMKAEGISLHAVQRGARRTAGLPSAFPCPAALDRNSAPAPRRAVPERRGASAASRENHRGPRRR